MDVERRRLLHDARKRCSCLSGFFASCLGDCVIGGGLSGFLMSCLRGCIMGVGVSSGEFAAT